MQGIPCIGEDGGIILRKGDFDKRQKGLCEEAASADAEGFRLCKGGISCLRARGGGFPIAPATPSGPLLIGLSRTQRRQVAAALSAAVTITKPIGDAPNLQAEPTPKKRPNPNASCSSGEGVWGRGASLREAASPPESPNRSLSGREREGGGLSVERPPPSHISIVPYFVNPFSASTTTVEVIVAPLTASTSSPSFTGSTLPMN